MMKRSQISKTNCVTGVLLSHRYYIFKKKSFAPFPPKFPGIFLPPEFFENLNILRLLLKN